MKPFNEYLEEAHNLSSKEGIHKYGVEKLSQAYIRHGVHYKNYDDKVTNNPRRKYHLDKIESGIDKHINASDKISKVRDSSGNKESEDLLNDIRHKALVKATEHHNAKS